MISLSQLLERFGISKSPAGHNIGFGPNRITVEVRRALRDPEGKCLRDLDGNIVYSEDLEIQRNHNVTCNAGLDAAVDRLFNSATTETVANYIALSESNDTPDAAHTLIADEITQSGLARATAAWSSGATGVCVLSKTFTATGTFSTVRLMGLLDAASTGDLYFEATFTSVALESGDQLTAKWDTITLS